ncbi:MAG: hypothetical protein SOX26_02155 [Phocaeicola sp.]|nr:hypothetical protein [Phocaeicola sp.]
MWSKLFYWIAFIIEKEVAVNLVRKNALPGKVWYIFVFEYGQAVFRCLCQYNLLRERYRSSLRCPTICSFIP